MNNAHFSHNKQDWETPQDFFDRLDSVWHFTLDVCATPDNAKCKRFFTKENDGLKQEWDGVVWCNPPYGREIARWVKKAYDSNCVVVMLLPARTDTSWFHDYVLPHAIVKFIRGRLKFGGSKNFAPFPSMICVFAGDGQDEGRYR